MRTEEARRIDDLAQRFTASELAAKLNGLRAGFFVKSRQADIAYRALGSIARGMWTEDGARIEAQRAYDAMLDANRQQRERKQ